MAVVPRRGGRLLRGSHGWGQSWLGGPCSLLTPRLSEFGLIWAIHSISTLPFSHHEYNEWFCEEFHSISTLPMPHHKYNEMFENIEIDYFMCAAAAMIVVLAHPENYLDISCDTSYKKIPVGKKCSTI
eukprot:scaffold249383_cov79-Cyclotella_meneghiniana.AAC.2